MKEYKIVKRTTGEVSAYARNGRGWVPMYSGYSSEGRDMAAHFAANLEAKGYARKA